MKEGMHAEYGICRYCRQQKMVWVGPGHRYSQEELNKIATSECDCEGAQNEQLIRDRITKGHWMISKHLERTFPEVYGIMDPAVGPLFQGDEMIKKVTVTTADHVIRLERGMKSLKLSIRQIDELQADSEEETEPEDMHDEDPGETEEE